MKSAKSAARTACKAAYRRRKIKQWKHKLSNDWTNDWTNDPNAWTSHGSMDASNAMPVSPVDDEASGLARQAQT